MGSSGRSRKLPKRMQKDPPTNVPVFPSSIDGTPYMRWSRRDSLSGFWLSRPKERRGSDQKRKLPNHWSRFLTMPLSWKRRWFWRREFYWIYGTGLVPVPGHWSSQTFRSKHFGNLIASVRSSPDPQCESLKPVVAMTPLSRVHLRQRAKMLLGFMLLHPTRLTIDSDPKKDVCIRWAHKRDDCAALEHHFTPEGFIIVKQRQIQRRNWKSRIVTQQGNPSNRRGRALGESSESGHRIPAPVGSL